MAAATSDILVRRGIEPGLVATVVASAVIHAGLLVLLVMLPGRFLKASPKLESYTVDLVAPDAIGGSNLVPGGGRAKPPSEPPPAVVPKPAPVEPAAAKPDADAPAAPPVPVAQAPKIAEPARPIQPQKPVEPPKPVEQAPKPAEAPPPAAANPPDAKPVAPPKPPPAAAVRPPEIQPPEAKAPAKPAEPSKPVANAAEPAKPIPPAAAKAAPAVNPPPADARKKPVAPAADTAAEKTAKMREDAITAAIQRRAAQVQGGAATANPDLDKQIAAAVQRRAQQVGQGAGGSGSEAGGPVSLGPGSGAGGTPADLQYILYQGRMEERIKAAWAWAGADKTLHAVIQFNLTPEGEIKNIHTIESSGDHQYDASCERAVRVVNPLDPVPEKYRKEFATVEMTFKPTDLEQ